MKSYGPWLLVLLVGLGCGPGAETDGGQPVSDTAVDPQPARHRRVSVGELVVGTWLPAGLDSYRFSAQDQVLLAGLGLNQIEWLQRGEFDG
ncbi:MAG TPA: hypothetical protein EYG11_18630, partial [Candidatus Latescibacteria bacterium]|nr:hypothetical protein [Candidatus Latescibacterota bacterium]